MKSHVKKGCMKEAYKMQCLDFLVLVKLQFCVMPLCVTFSQNPSQNFACACD